MFSCHFSIIVQQTCSYRFQVYVYFKCTSYPSDFTKCSTFSVSTNIFVIIIFDGFELLWILNVQRILYRKIVFSGNIIGWILQFGHCSVGSDEQEMIKKSHLIRLLKCNPFDAAIFLTTYTQYFFYFFFFFFSFFFCILSQFHVMNHILCIYFHRNWSRSVFEKSSFLWWSAMFWII